MNFQSSNFQSPNFRASNFQSPNFGASNSRTSNSRASQSFEADVNAFYDLLSEIRRQPPQQTIGQFRDLLTEASRSEEACSTDAGSADAGSAEPASAGTSSTDTGLHYLWQRIVTNPRFEQYSTHFFNRCCYILINHWSVQPSHRGAHKSLVDLLGQAAQAEVSAVWSPGLRAFYQSPQFGILEQLVKAEETPSSQQQTSSDPRQQPLSQLIHHYPFLYPAYFTRYNATEEGRRSVLQMKEKREISFDCSLMRLTRQLKHRGLEGLSNGDCHNPTLLPHTDLAVALHEFSGVSQSGIHKASHNYQQAADACLQQIVKSPSNRVMKGQIQDYLSHGFQAYGCSKGQNISHHRFGSWLNQRLDATQVELDHQQPTLRSLVQTCGNLLNLILAHPKDVNGLNNHARFIDLVTNLGATFSIGIVLKLLMLCRVPQANLTALRSAVAKRFVRLFSHYESNPAVENVSNVAWLIDCLDNYMIASAVHFGSSHASAWEQMLSA